MATKVFLIRHGETEGAESKRYKGHIDVPLSLDGIEQAKRLAAFLSAEDEMQTSVLSSFRASGLKAVYCSSLSRAVKTAEAVAAPFGLQPVVNEGLKERNFGAWEGMTFHEIKEKWPDAFNAWAENPLRFSPMEGESTLDVRDRAVATFNEIVSAHEGDSIAVVAHGGINRVILCELLAIPLENIFRVEQDFACVNVIELWDYPVIRALNYVV